MANNTENHPIWPLEGYIMTSVTSERSKLQSVIFCFIGVKYRFFGSRISKATSWPLGAHLCDLNDLWKVNIFYWHFLLHGCLHKDIWVQDFKHIIGFGLCPLGGHLFDLDDLWEIKCSALLLWTIVILVIKVLYLFFLHNQIKNEKYVPLSSRYQKDC